MNALTEKNLFIVGPSGSGKSHTGNTISRNNNWGERQTRVGTDIHIKKTSNGGMIGDFLGFTDYDDHDVFLTRFLAKRNELEEVVKQRPIDAFLLVIKFERETSHGFHTASKHFVKLFGTQTIESLVIICIQSSFDEIYSDNDFKPILKNSEGYKYLKEKNQNIDVPYCLWDNIRPYPEQNAHLLACLENRRKIELRDIGFIFDLVNNELQSQKVIRDIIEDNDRKSKEQAKNGSCQIL